MVHLPPSPFDKTPLPELEPPWLPIARRELGVHETLGPKATARIVEYHKATSLKATSDETPWCASFVNWAFAQVGIRATGSARALSFAPWGVFLKEPRLGCVAVIEHPGGRGHVAFVVGRDATTKYLHLLGGNQGDSVSIKRTAESAIIGYRWPRGVPVPAFSPLPVLDGGAALGGVANTR
jgi:uncharacterized protein (TIGR02594 family)